MVLAPMASLKSTSIMISAREIPRMSTAPLLTIATLMISDQDVRDQRSQRARDTRKKAKFTAHQEEPPTLLTPPTTHSLTPNQRETHPAKSKKSHLFRSSAATFGSSHSTDQMSGDGLTSTSQALVRTTKAISLLPEPLSVFSVKVSMDSISTRMPTSHGNARLLVPTITPLTEPSKKSELVNSRTTMNSGPHGEEELTTAASTHSLSLMVTTPSSDAPWLSMPLTALVSLAVLSSQAALHAPMVFALHHPRKKQQRKDQSDPTHTTTETPRVRISLHVSNNISNES